MTATVAGIHLGIDTHANRPAANTVPDGSIYSCSTHSLVYKSNFAGNSWATWATLGSAAASGGQTFLANNVTMTNTNTYYDGASQSLAAGTYMLFASVAVIVNTNATHVATRLWDGTTVYDEEEVYHSTAGGTVTHHLRAYVVLGSTTTVKVSASRNGGSNTSVIAAETQTGSPGATGTADKVTNVSWIKIA